MENDYFDDCDNFDIQAGIQSLNKIELPDDEFFYDNLIEFELLPRD